MFKNIAHRTLNVVVIVSLGVCYVWLLRLIMTQYIQNFGDVFSSQGKMTLTGLSALLAISAVLIFNFLLTRKNSVWIGISSSVMAFCYFYIHKAIDGVIAHIVMVFMTPYSLFAFCAFLGIPLLLGLALNKALKSQAPPAGTPQSGAP